MDYYPGNYDDYELTVLQTRRDFLERKLEHLQRQLDYRINAYQMTSESLQRTIRGLADVSQRHVSIFVLRGDKLRYETELADMEEEVFQMMGTVREMRDEYRVLISRLEALQNLDGVLQAQVEGDEEEVELDS